jgi:hypothetical protein
MNYYFFCYIPTGMPAHVHIIICPLVAVGDLPVCRMGVRWFGVQVARPGATGQISADAQGNVSFYFVAMFGLSSAKQKEVYYNKSQGKGWYCQHGRLGVFICFVLCLLAFVPTIASDLRNGLLPKEP